MINKILRSLLIGMMLLSISDIFGGGDAKKKMQSPQAMTRIVDQSSAANFTQVSRNNLNVQNGLENPNNSEFLDLELMKKERNLREVTMKLYEIYGEEKSRAMYTLTVDQLPIFTVDQLQRAETMPLFYNFLNTPIWNRRRKEKTLAKRSWKNLTMKLYNMYEKRRLQTMKLTTVDQLQEVFSEQIPFNALNIQIWNNPQAWNNPKEKAKMWDFLMGTFHKISMNVYKENGILKIKNFLDELQKFINWWFIENDALSYLDKESKDQLEQDEKNLRDFWKGVVQLFQRNNGMIVNEVIGDRDGKLDVENREIRLKEVQQLIEGLIHINGKNINDKTELETLKILINREIMMMQLQQTLQKRYGVGC